MTNYTVESCFKSIPIFNTGVWGSRYISDKSVTIFYPNSQVNPEFSFHIWTIHDVTLDEDQSKYGGYLRVCLLFAYILPVHVPSQNFYLEIILSNHLLRTWVHLEALWLSSRSKNLPDFSDVADGFSVRTDLSLSRRGDLFSLEPWATSSVVCFLRHTAGIWPKMSRMTGQALQTNPSNYLTLVTEKVPPMFFQS